MNSLPKILPIIAVFCILLSSASNVSSQSSGMSPAERPAAGRAPFDDQTWMVTSRDGRNFSGSTPILLSEHASMPDILIHPSGRYFIYFTDFAENAGPSRLTVLVSDDQGASWRRNNVVVAPPTTSTRAARTVAIDPDAVMLPDGKIRLFYFSPAIMQTAQPNQPDPHAIHSAISIDGIKFTEETGVRFAGPGITDPDVVALPDGTWKMYFVAHTSLPVLGSNRGKILSASSTDGLSFTLDPGLVLDYPGIPGSVVLPNGMIRMFVNIPAGIASYISRDGISFRFEAPMMVDPEGRMLADPSPAILPDGSCILVYKRSPISILPPGMTRPPQLRSMPPFQGTPTSPL